LTTPKLNEEKRQPAIAKPRDKYLRQPKSKESRAVPNHELPTLKYQGQQVLPNPAHKKEFFLNENYMLQLPH
jgi:hypothetical protein